jgi:hypothetical protein
MKDKPRVSKVKNIEDMEEYVLHPHGRRDETALKKFTWKCNTCGKTYLYKGVAEECWTEHDKNDHPEKYIQDSVVRGKISPQRLHHEHEREL